MEKAKLMREERSLVSRYNNFKKQNLNLDMSRGKPCKEQVALSSSLVSTITSRSKFVTDPGIDCRNYGVLDGIPKMKQIFADLLGVEPDNVIVGGNSSLNMMFDAITCLFVSGVPGCVPWRKEEKIKFLCPVPGYDRHFSMLDYFGIEPINVPMLNTGPDMNVVEKAVSLDDKIKGIWCVPKYSNPQGITYSDDTVKRFARLRPLAKDFRIFWDNAYMVHGLCETDDVLSNIITECKVSGNEDLPIVFCSTSKITFPGGGIAAVAASDRNIGMLKKQYSNQTIGFDKINQLRHVLFLKDTYNIMQHMKKHKNIIKPKFDLVLSILERELRGLGICKWTYPRGGYFISVDVMPGCAKEVVRLCKEAGVILTPAGATFPRGEDPKDSNIRLAPTYPSIKELSKAMEVFCVSLKLTVVRKIKEGEKNDQNRPWV